MGNIKYKKNGRVAVDMSMEDYRALLKGFNDLKGALNMMADCHTIYLSDVGKLDDLMYKLKNSLDFVDGEGYYSDATLPTLNPRLEEKQ
jgi:hypothetical protein